MMMITVTMIIMVTPTHIHCISFHCGFVFWLNALYLCICIPCISMRIWLVFFFFYLRQASKYFYAYLVFLYLCQAPSIIASHTILDYCSAYPLIIHPLMGRHALANKSLPYLGFGVRYLRRLFQQPTIWHIWVFGWTTYRGYIWPDPLNIWVLGIWFLIFSSVHSV